MKKVKSKLSTFMQNFVAMGLLMLLTLLLCFTTSPFEKSQPKTIDAVSIMPSAWKYDESRQAYFAELGTYPQTYVGDELNSELVPLLKSGALDAAATGNTYISNDRASEEKHYEEKQNKEYEYNGDLYVAVENQQIYPYHTIKNFSTGDLLGNTGDTKFFKVEPIKWYIIDGTDPESAPAGTQCKVISDLALNAMPFNATSDDGNVWRDSLIREYLNGNFYQSTGLANEDVVILQHNQNNVKGNLTDGSGPATDDYVYLLSYQEVNGEYEFLDTADERITTPTDFALSNGAAYLEGAAAYWLRSASSIDYSSCYVNFDGSRGYGVVYSNILGVRPALTLDLDSMPEPGEVEPIYISTAEELKQLSDYSAAGGIFNPNWKFYLENDIDMSSIPNFAIGSIDNPFTGYFNGRGHTITNLTNFAGAFGGLIAVGKDCTIVNVNIKNTQAATYSNEGFSLGGVIGVALGNVLIDNIDVQLGEVSLSGNNSDMCILAGVAAWVGSTSPNSLSDGVRTNFTASNCNITFSKINISGVGTIGGVVGFVTGGDVDTRVITNVSSCMILYSNVQASNMEGVIIGGVAAYVMGYVDLNIQQIYCQLPKINTDVSGMLFVGGLGGLIGDVVAAINYSEVCVVEPYATTTAGGIGYEIGFTDKEEIVIFGTNSVFNFASNVTDTGKFYKNGSRSGIIDVQAKQYYSGFTDRKWVVFPTDKHPTIREFMAIGDFATVQSVEDKLIELGYTRVM